jgi:hypothetical protein
MRRTERGVGMDWGGGGGGGAVDRLPNCSCNCWNNFGSGLIEIMLSREY